MFMLKMWVVVTIVRYNVKNPRNKVAIVRNKTAIKSQLHSCNFKKLNHNYSTRNNIAKKFTF